MFGNLIDMNDPDEQPERISIDDLYENKQKRDVRALNTFKLILGRIHNKIKLTSRQQIDQQFCWFVVPEFMLGVPSYNHGDCVVYVLEQLQENGFKVKYTHPNLLLISWQHWVPDYVRRELKKKTGVDIDGNGNPNKKKGSDLQGLAKGPTNPFAQTEAFGLRNQGMAGGGIGGAIGEGGSSGAGPGGYEGFDLDMSLARGGNRERAMGKEKDKDKDKEYRDIRSYNPRGGLIYKESMLRDLQKKFE